MKLGGGSSSPFKINIAGTPGPVATNIELKAGDSTYIFATVSINPTIENLPFIVRDSIEITYNGNTKWVQLQAFGQNAHFIRNQTFTGTTIWNNDLPYVIMGKLIVDTNAVLIINKGCNIFVNANAPIIINGSLQVMGEKWDSTRVVFTGDRLDEPYRNYPASYPGIFFTSSSKNNSITYTTIKNAFRGVMVSGPSVNGAPKLTLAQTIIHNAFDAGLLALNTSVSAQNVLVSNCGKNVVLQSGGNYQFLHCTMASGGSVYVPHSNPVLEISRGDDDAAAAPLNALFKNCIFWAEGGGQVAGEVVISKKGTTPFSVSFENVLWRVQSTPANATVSGVVINGSPLFISNEKELNFRLKEGSPAIDKGSASGLTVDLDGAPRPVGAPDLGAYEKQ